MFHSFVYNFGGASKQRIATGATANRIADAFVQARIRGFKFSLQLSRSLMQRDMISSCATV
ncbi:MAG TPA: hypothetical protein VIH74_07820 [Candidatus Acidoferrum sp.]